MVKSLLDLSEMWKGHTFESDLDGQNYLVRDHPIIEQAVSPGLYGTYLMDISKAEYLHVSNGFKDMLGIDLASQLKREGMAYMDGLIHPDDREQVAMQVNKCWEFSLVTPIDKRKSYKFNMEYRLKDSIDNYVRILQQLVILELDKKGLPLITLGICTDISYMGSLEHPTLAVQGPTDEHYIYDHTKGELIGKGIFTNREQELLKLLAKGLSSAEISLRLEISVQTVQKHRRNMLEKAGKSNTVELVVYALKCGVL